MSTINLPNSRKLKSVLERKRDYLKGQALEMGKYAPSSYDRRAYSLLSGPGIEWAVYHKLLENGIVDSDSLVRTLNKLDNIENSESGRKRIVERVGYGVEDLIRYVTPVEGLDDEFIGFHDRGYEITVPFPEGCKLVGQDMVLQVDDLGRIRYACHPDHMICGPTSVNYKGDPSRFIPALDGWFSFPEVGTVQTNFATGEAKLESLAKGDKLGIIPKAKMGFASVVKKVDSFYHDPSDVRGYISNLTKHSHGKKNPFDEFLEGRELPMYLSKDEMDVLMRATKGEQ